MLNILKSDERMADAILDSLGVYPDEVEEEAMRHVSNLYQTYTWEKERTRVQLK